MIKMSFKMIGSGASVINSKRGLTITPIDDIWVIICGRPRAIKNAVKDVTENSSWKVFNLRFVD